MVGAGVWSDATGGGKKFEVGLSYIVGIGVLPTKSCPENSNQKAISKKTKTKKQKPDNSAFLRKLKQACFLFIVPF